MFIKNSSSVINNLQLADLYESCSVLKSCTYLYRLSIVFRVLEYKVDVIPHIFAHESLSKIVRVL